MERIGTYEVVETLARGVGTLVVRAKHPSLDRQVILRCALPSAVSRVRAAIEEEAKFLNALAHPNVVRCLDLFSDAGQPVIVLADVQGVNLGRVLEATPRLPIATVCEIGRSLASALDAVHRKGVIHADVKPSNVVLGEDGIVVLIDFGHAIPEGARHHEAGGTAAYMAPERLVGDALPASDVFSLGVCLYEMLTGSKPFDAKNQRGRAEDPLLAPRKWRPEVPEWLDALILRCLARSSAERPSARDLERTFAAHVDGGPRLIRHALVAARLLSGDEPEPPPLRASREEQKRRFVYWGGSAALLLLSVSAFVLLRASVTRVEGAPGFLRVAASPWADVTVDGVRVDTTPFARAILLTPGKHFVLFEHPRAAPERREIEIQSNATEFLEIAMKVPVAPSARKP